jgi:hypothetical protein
MKDIVIKAGKNCDSFVTEAVERAIFYQANVATDNPGLGKSHGTVYTKYASASNINSRWDFLVYETKKAFVVEISYHTKK